MNSIFQYDQTAFISEAILDYFKGQGKPTLFESTVKTGANQLGAPSACNFSVVPEGVHIPNLFKVHCAENFY